MALEVTVHAKDEVNLNYYNSKIVSLWNITLDLFAAEGNPIYVSDLTPTYRTVDSPRKFSNISNIGAVLASDNAKYSIAPACDGLMFPFAENGGLAYSPGDYAALLGLVLDATQGQGQSLWALHYGWMWDGAFGPNTREVDPHALAAMISTDRAAEVDAVVIWGMRMEVGNIGSQRGIFSQRNATTLAAAQKQSHGGWAGVAQAWFPGFTPGYGGFHQSWTSRVTQSGNLSFGLNRAVGVVKRTIPVGNASGPWYFGAVIRVANGPVLYNASANVAVTKGESSDGGEVECPGLDTAAAAQKISCTVRWIDRTMHDATFPEVVTIGIPAGGDLSSAANGNIRLVLELYEHKGVGNFAGGAEFAVPATGTAPSGDLVDGWLSHGRSSHFHANLFILYG